MAVRIRKDGRIFCAALTEAHEGDQYIDDGVHYELSTVKKILVTTPHEIHVNKGGEWWWKDQVPEEIEIDKFYLF